MTIKSDDGAIPACSAEVATRLEELVDERRWIPVGERLPGDEKTIRYVVAMIPTNCPCCEVPYPPHRDGCTFHVDCPYEAQDFDEGTAGAKAIEIAVRFGGIGGDHHKAWVIDQMVRALAGDRYDAIVKEACNDGEFTWDVGIPPSQKRGSPSSALWVGGEAVSGRSSKQKGKRGEREAAAELGALLGVDARRGVQYQGGPGSPDVVLDGVAIHVEAKRTEKLSLWPAVDQAKADAPRGSVPIVWHRPNRRGSVIVVETARLLELAREVVRCADAGPSR